MRCNVKGGLLDDGEGHFKEAALAEDQSLRRRYLCLVRQKEKREHVQRP